MLWELLFKGNHPAYFSDVVAGRTSTKLRSSAYFKLRVMELSEASLMRAMKMIEPNLVPWGTPPERTSHSPFRENRVILDTLTPGCKEVSNPRDNLTPHTKITHSGVTGEGAAEGGRRLTGFFADLPGKERQGKKEQRSRKEGKLIKGKVENWKWNDMKSYKMRRVFFFFFFFFTFQNHWYLFWVYQYGNFLPEKHFTPGKE